MGGMGFIAFERMLRAGWPETEARNALLLLMVLFENIHIGNSRSETVAALRMFARMAGSYSSCAVHRQSCGRSYSEPPSRLSRISAEVSSSPRPRAINSP